MPYGICTPFFPDYSGNSASIFNFQFEERNNGEYIRVNYRTQPWQKHITSATPYGDVSIPIRHKMDLWDVLSCYEFEGVTQQVFADPKFEFWEANARNIVAELSGVIASQREWALRDAIAIANVPYNRQRYNQSLTEGPSANNTFSWQGTTVPWEDVAGKTYARGTSDLKTILLSPGQFAITSNGLAMNPENTNHYGFALVVAYGVHMGYFRDTSYGATDYVHRNVDNEFHGLTCGSGDPKGFQSPLFLYLFPRSVYGLNQFPHALTTAELNKRHEWPEWGNYPSPYNGWSTGYPPSGCTEVN